MFSAVILINQMAMQVMSCLRVAILFLLTLILNTLYVSQNTVKNMGNTRWDHSESAQNLFKSSPRPLKPDKPD